MALKVLLHTIFYPMAIGRYWERALQRRADIDLMTVGVFTGSWIPWKGGMNVASKYATSPDIPLPYHFSNPVADWSYVEAQLGGWKPDLIITVDAGSRWSSKPSTGYVAHIATDAHCLNYDQQRRDSDKFFNMHERYAQAGDYILPYAFDPTVHRPEPETEKIYDVAMVGVEYGHRIELAQRLQAEGLRVLFSNGDIFDEYRHSNCQAHVGVNWSSLDDLNARAFELPAMGVIPVMNYVKDMSLPRHSYFDHAYLFPCVNDAQSKAAFVHGAVEKVKFAMNNLDSAKERTETMRQAMKNETYDARLQELFDACGFGG